MTGSIVHSLWKSPSVRQTDFWSFVSDERPILDDKSEPHSVANNESGGFVMKCKSTGSLVATFLGTDNLRHPYKSIVYCGSSFPYSIQIVNDISTRSYFSIYTCGYPRIKAKQYKRQV